MNSQLRKVRPSAKPGSRSPLFPFVSRPGCTVKRTATSSSATASYLMIVGTRSDCSGVDQHFQSPSAFSTRLLAQVESLVPCDAYRHCKQAHVRPDAIGYATERDIDQTPSMWLADCSPSRCGRIRLRLGRRQFSPLYQTLLRTPDIRMSVTYEHSKEYSHGISRSVYHRSSHFHARTIVAHEGCERRPEVADCYAVRQHRSVVRCCGTLFQGLVR